MSTAGRLHGPILAALLPLALPFLPATQEEWSSEEDSTEATQFFTVPLTRSAAELAAQADAHLAAERFGEGILALQRLVSENAGDLLPHARREGVRLSLEGEGLPAASAVSVVVVDYEGLAAFSDCHEVPRIRAGAR